VIRRRELVYLFVLYLAVSAAIAGGQTSREPAQSSPAPLSPQQMFRLVAPSVMVVESLDTKGSITVFGSGIVIAPGRVVTNRHVIEDGVSYRAEHGSKKWPATLVRVDPDHDLAELSVAGLDAPAVHVRDSSTLAVGEKVYAIGAPEGLELTISEGLISGLRDFNKDRVIQTSAAISPGSSGGGLFDAEGRLVGITTFYLKEGQSLNFALPAEWTLALDRAPANGPPANSQDSPAFAALVWWQAALKAAEAGEFKISAHALEEALRLEPGEEQGWVILGYNYVVIGRYDEALGAYQTALRLKPDDENGWFGIGCLYERLGQYGKAISSEQEAIRLKPGYELAWVCLGLAYLDLRKYDQAMNADQEAVRLKPDDARAWYDMGLALKGEGRQSDVIRVYEKLKALDAKLADQFFREAVLP